MRTSNSTVWVLAIVGLLTTAFLVGLVVPGQRRLNSQRRLIVAELAEIEAQQARVAGTAALYRDVMESEKRLANFEKAVPPTHDFAATFRQLTNSMTARGMSRSVVEPELVRGVETRAPRNVTMADRVRVQPVRIRSSAETSQLFAFLKDMESRERLIAIRELHLKYNSSQARDSSHGFFARQPRPPEIQCEMTLNTFFLPRYGDNATTRPSQPGPVATRN